MLYRRAAWFFAGWLTVALALLSPLHGLAERFFWVHMVEHELLMVVAAPLLVASQPQAALIWGLGAGWARRFAIATPAVLLRKSWSWATQPLAAWSLHTAVLWVWHVPALFEAALRHEAVHAVQHVSFLGVAVAYWSSIAGARHGLASRGVAVLSLFATSMQCGLLGALLALGTVPLYPTYAHEAGFDADLRPATCRGGDVGAGQPDLRGCRHSAAARLAARSGSQRAEMGGSPVRRGSLLCPKAGLRTTTRNTR